MFSTSSLTHSIHRVRLVSRNETYPDKSHQCEESFFFKVVTLKSHNNYFYLTNETFIFFSENKQVGYTIDALDSKCLEGLVTLFFIKTHYGTNSVFGQQHKRTAMCFALPGTKARH